MPRPRHASGGRPGRAPGALLAGLALAALCAALASAPARAQNYPRLGLYGQISGSGYPLWGSTGAYDTRVLDEISRYDEVILDASPISEYRNDALTQLRQRHPGIKLLAYVTGHHIWPTVAADSTVFYPKRYWNTVRDLDGFLYNTSGAQYGLTNYAFANVNIAKRDGTGRYVVAEALAQLFYDAIISKNVWDGLFVDTYCTTISWSQSGTEMIDYVRAGYPSITAFDAGWSAGTDTLAARLRQLAGPTEILVGNCIPGTKYAWFNGWMAENFPFQNGGTWDENMFRDPGGYFASERGYLAPRYNHLFSGAATPSDPYSATNMRQVRLGLASASLGEGFGVFGYSARNVTTYPYHHWWYDEYAVDRATGRSSALRKDTGWLGRPLGPYGKVIWVSGAADAITNNGFESDLSGWTWSSMHPASLTRDATTAAKGNASAKFSLSAAESVPWGAGVATTTTLTMIVSQYYSATFWAKASAARTVTVVAGAPGGGELAHGTADLTTAWKQFQIVFRPVANGAAPLQFFLGAQAGDVWLDDVHYQAGTSSIYRRDFEHGILLLNPTFLTLSVPLERSYYKIRGSADPATNDGTRGSQFTVPPMDALFLLGTDQVRPASVLDLHVTP